jgi:Secretion system C-terminal sorting domain
MIKNLTLLVLLMCTLQGVAQDNKAMPLKFAFRHSDSLRAVLPAGSILNTNSIVYNTFRNELWMASSHNDSLLRFSVPAAKYLGAVRATGLIAPVTNTTRFFRGLTVKDDYFIWGVNNTDTIRKLDPTTGKEVARFVVPKWMGNQSMITYDPTKGGAFWVLTSFGSTFRRVDSTFQTVTDSIVIDASFQTRSLSYCAFDATSAGGPYLWVMGDSHPDLTTYGSQNIQNISITATQISVATKKRTGVQKSLIDDFSFLINVNQAPRGMTIAQIPGNTKPTLIMSVGKFTSGSSVLLPADLSGVTLGFELGNTVLPDASVDTIQLTPNYSMLPAAFQRPLSIKTKIRNAVSFTTTAGNARVQTRNAAGVVINTQSVPFSTNALTSAFYDVPNAVTGFTKGLNSINVTSIVTNDPISRNDTLTAFLMISDSTIARDYVDFYDMPALESTLYRGANRLTHTLGTGITSLIPERPEIGQAYKMDWPITITSATARVKPGRSGDTTRFNVYTFNATGKPVFAGRSALYQITPEDSANQTITLPLIAPLNMGANQEFMITMTEGFNAPNVWGTPMGYEPGKTFIHLQRTYGGWVRIDTSSNANLMTNYSRALAIRPNIRLRTDIGETANVTKLALSPNPTNGIINLSVDMDKAEDLVVRVYNLSGQAVLTQKYDNLKSLNQDIDLSQQANGVYIVTLTTAKGTLTRKVVKE